MDVYGFTLFLYQGASVWVPDPDAVWVPAHLLEDYSPGRTHVHLQRSDGKVGRGENQRGGSTQWVSSVCHKPKLCVCQRQEVHYPVASPADLPPLANPDISEGENDLTALSFLHEPAILHNLRVRFLDYCSIYTYCGEQEVIR